MFGFCTHKKLTDIKDGYQYCESCNKAFLVKCNHKYIFSQELTSKSIFSGNTIRIQKVYKCECGHLKIVSFHKDGSVNTDFV